VSEYKPTVLVDFDGVLHSYVSGWTGPVPTDPPSPGAVEFVQALQLLGCEAVVFTTRANTSLGGLAVGDWLDQHGFPADLAITHEKLPCICLIDDRAVCYDRKRGFQGALDEVGEFKAKLRP
jgi:hypothetical protein